MRIVVDTNVFISGVFFTGLPYRILDAWRGRTVQIVISPQILDEYRRVGEELASRFPDIHIEPWLALLVRSAILVQPAPIAEQVCRDPDDDKFLACAMAAKTKIVVSGDKALREVSGYAGIAVLTPRQFVDQYLTQKI
jgi:uncharacterized protein